MLFYYGTKASTLKKGQIINVDCPICESNVSMMYSVFGKYAHLYLIPFFPIKKMTYTECNSCKKTFEKFELPSNIQTKLERENEKDRVSNPIWMFSGLFIIAIIASYGFYSSYETDANSEKYIKNPKIGDIYYVKSSEGFFSTMKVNTVSKDSISALINEMEIDKKTNMDEIDKDQNYKDAYSFSKKDILKLYNEENIYEVKRN
ncbi:zinc-ribbon domain-containing protein [Flavobacterium branchiarum]|uniref:Zinc-ribbon domain-containing protein n=1 Tax=Flavobacterium branchiarum TaxID=1114870 RepID=A0ABV5FGX7_9FLAO|nr:zinc-ribbon domain-containing protein [Flavobacterium branchiarum]MDN3673625.1 zinc-ribbon domain-containing protein [Flavobacterium branchiarum]